MLGARLAHIFAEAPQRDRLQPEFGVRDQRRRRVARHDIAFVAAGAVLDGVAVAREPDEQPRVGVCSGGNEKIVECLAEPGGVWIGGKRYLEPMPFQRLRDGLGVLDGAAERGPARRIIVDANDERFGAGIKLDLPAGGRALCFAGLERDFEGARCLLRGQDCGRQDCKQPRSQENADAPWHHAFCPHAQAHLSNSRTLQQTPRRRKRGASAKCGDVRRPPHPALSPRGEGEEAAALSPGWRTVRASLFPIRIRSRMQSQWQARLGELAGEGQDEGGLSKVSAATFL